MTPVTYDPATRTWAWRTRARRLRGRPNHNASTGSSTFAITPAAPTCTVTGYAVTYDGAAHTATGSCTGVSGESLSGLDLSASTHTAAGTTSDAWTYTDATGNYSNASGTVADSIAKAPLTVTAASFTRSHTAPNPTLTGTIAGEVAGDGITATYSTAAANVPGVFPIVPALVDPNGKLGDYAVTLVNGTLTLTNAAPVALDNSYTGQWNAPLVVTVPGVIANDSDGDGDALTATLVGGTTHGTVTLNADGSVTYVPNPNYSGHDAFTYTVSDAFGGTSNVATVTIVITSPCHSDADDQWTPKDRDDHNAHRNGHHDGDGCAYERSKKGHRDRDDDGDKDRDRTFDRDDCSAGTPVANAEEYDTIKNVAITESARNGVQRNDSRGTITSVVLVGVQHGTLAFNADGSFSYTPAPGFVGTDSFVYVDQDTSGVRGNAATVTLDVHPCPGPNASDDHYTGARNAPLTVPAASGVLANDTDPSGDALTVTILSGVAHGTLSLNADGSFSYTPAHNFAGTDAFTYTVSDGTKTDTARVYITVPNHAPVANDNAFTTPQGTAVSGNVLTNDTDADGDALTASNASHPGHGTVALNSDGSFTYTPTASFSGTDSFTYTVSDGTATDTGKVVITVTKVNHAPVATADAFITGKNTTLAINSRDGVLENDTDADGDALTAVLVTSTAHGTLTLHADGSFTYKPASNFTGTDSFTYKVSDGTATSAPVTVTITVSTHYDGDGCDHDRHRNGHHDGDGCDHDDIHDGRIGG